MLSTLADRLRRTVDPWLQEVDGTWSLTETRARIVAIRDEAEDLRTFVLAPNGRWRGHRAGQFVSVTVAVDGVRSARCYSLSSSPDAQYPSITVRRVPGGQVSEWLHAKASVGDVVRLGPASGDFVVSDSPRPLLLLSGGSGITPVLAIARDLARRGALDGTVFVHAARSDAATPHAIRDELETLLQGNAHFTVGPMSPDRLIDLVPDWATRRTMLCGPLPMMDALAALWRAHDLEAQLVTERFTGPVPAGTPSARDDEEPTSVKVTLAGGKRSLTLAPAPSLLAALEAAGERPAYGCRQGICNTCRCHKVSGLVEDLTTGRRSAAANEEIRLCTSRALSDLELTFGDAR